ncbi:MAG: hypothetical protein WCA32_12095 [Chromatiaceae bacterium]|jgi:hypothetical protein
MSELDAFEPRYALADRVITGASKDEVPEAVRVLALNVAGYQKRYGAAPFERFANMLRDETIDPETAELLSAGRRQLGGVLGIVRGLDEDHATTDVH